MSSNPYSSTISRYFGIVLYTAGALLFAYLAIRSVSSGQTSGLWRFSRIVGDSYTSAASPSQFWLVVVVYTLAAAVSAWFAWRSYSGQRT
jgi:hypothetical protein